MLSSKNLRTRALGFEGKLVCGGQEGQYFVTNLNKGGPIINSLSFKINQPGLPSWWRLAAPNLNWISAFTKHLIWAVLMISPNPLLLGGESTIKADWLTPRASLVTLTRGPMARKKKSRVQFMLVRKPLQLRLSTKKDEELLLSTKNFRGALAMLQAEEGFWASILPSPMTLAKSKLTVNISSPALVIWR